MRNVLIGTLTMVLTLVACERKRPDPAAIPPAVGNSSSTNRATRVARIVFIDKEQACPCTRKRIDETWAAMQAALGTPPSLPVERIYVDTQAPQAGAYTVVKPLMVLPGIYFVDANNTVIDMLQGEVKVEPIAAILKGR